MLDADSGARPFHFQVRASVTAQNETFREVISLVFKSDQNSSIHVATHIETERGRGYSLGVRPKALVKAIKGC